MILVEEKQLRLQRNLNAGGSNAGAWLPGHLMGCQKHWNSSRNGIGPSVINCPVNQNPVSPAPALGDSRNCSCFSSTKSLERTPFGLVQFSLQNLVCNHFNSCLCCKLKKLIENSQKFANGHRCCKLLVLTPLHTPLHAGICCISHNLCQYGSSFSARILQKDYC